ncbi:TRAP transporter small permease [Celerinatantimonas sp. YJH-8]|uniref:TRAP transporter small permease n=1 Tax=Celerinatantimonas sp. YJH-8 TaxID=3228714 RepID=UPI0038BEA59C
MIASVVWQVFTRFVLHDPANFTDELSRYLLIWIGILGGAYTYAIKRHLALEIMMPHFNHRGQLCLGILINFIVILFSSTAFIYGGYYLVKNTLLHGQISPGIAFGTHHLLIGYVYLVVPISGAIITYFGCVDIIKSIASFIKKEPLEMNKEPTE